jgi:hypothetical protein
VCKRLEREETERERERERDREDIKEGERGAKQRLGQSIINHTEIEKYFRYATC